MYFYHVKKNVYSVELYYNEFFILPTVLVLVSIEELLHLIAQYGMDAIYLRVARVFGLRDLDPVPHDAQNGNSVRNWQPQSAPKHDQSNAKFPRQTFQKPMARTTASPKT